MKTTDYWINVQHNSLGGVCVALTDSIVKQIQDDAYWCGYKDGENSKRNEQPSQRNSIQPNSTL